MGARFMKEAEYPARREALAIWAVTQFELQVWAESAPTRLPSGRAGVGVRGAIPLRDYLWRCETVAKGGWRFSLGVRQLTLLDRRSNSCESLLG